MTTTTERDEELEEFIEDTLLDCSSTPTEDLHKVAAFSARRAREKAIEECQNKIRSNYGGDEDEGLVEAVTLIEELKSPTNYPMILG